MSKEYLLRRKGREGLVRAIADQERKEGRIPNMREVERKAHEVADRNDRKKDR